MVRSDERKCLVPAPTPGTTVVGRYAVQRVVDEGFPVGSASGAAGAGGFGGGLLRAHAIDEVLHRPVTLWSLPAGHPRVTEFARAARRSATVADPRFPRVLDAVPVDSSVIVITERLSGTCLTDQLLVEGPLPASTAVPVLIEVCQAVAAAQRAGLFVPDLTPDAVLRTELDQVKIDRLLQEPGPEPGAGDPVLATRTVAAVLYATLTGRWPAAWTGYARLPAAPLAESGKVRTPRQVRAGIPADLDDVVERALLPEPTHGRPVTSPEELAGLLERLRLPDTVRLSPPRRPRRPTTARVAQVSAIGVLVGGLGLAGIQVASNMFGLGTPSPASPRPVASQPPPAASSSAAPLHVAAVRDFDPDGDGTENPREVGNAVDGNESTAWHTMTYFRRPELGGLKPGVGLVLDLGHVTTVRGAALTLVGSGTSLQLRVARTWSDSEQGYQPISATTTQSTRVRLQADQPVQARYVLVWLTSLPQVAPDRYRGGVAEISVFG